MTTLEAQYFSLFQTGVAIQHLNKRSEKYLGLSLVQWCLLKILIDMPAASAQTLANAVGLHPSTLTQTLKRLEKKKLIFVTEDSFDSRKKLISLTRLGNNVLEAACNKMESFSNDLSGMQKELLQMSHQLRK